MFSFSRAFPPILFATLFICIGEFFYASASRETQVADVANEIEYLSVLIIENYVMMKIMIALYLPSFERVLL